MPEASTVIDLKLPSGEQAAVRAVAIGGAQDVARLPTAEFKVVTDTIEEIGTALSESLSRIAPKRAKVTFGVELAVKSGKLVSLIAEGGGTATLSVELEWGS
jgi:hypothetical protein